MVDVGGRRESFGAKRRLVLALRANPIVALAIDTDTSPPQSINIRGHAEIDGLASEYVAAAHRHLGDAAAACSPAWTNRARSRPASR